MFFNQKKQKIQAVPSKQDQNVIDSFWKTSLQELETQFYNKRLLSIWPEKHNKINVVLTVIK
jgi:hypothetical protein